MAEKGKPIRQVVDVVATGRLGSEPKEVGKYTAASLAVNQRIKDDDGEWTDGPTMWWDLMDGGDHLEGLDKGDVVTVKGRLSMRDSEEYGKRFTIWVDKAGKAEAKEAKTQKAAKSKPEPDIAFPD